MPSQEKSSHSFKPLEMLEMDTHQFTCRAWRLVDAGIVGIWIHGTRAASLIDKLISENFRDAKMRLGESFL